MILRNATLHDGSGAPGRPADLRISGGVVAAIDRPGVLPAEPDEVDDGE